MLGNKDGLELTEPICQKKKWKVVKKQSLIFIQIPNKMLNSTKEAGQLFSK